MHRYIYIYYIVFKLGMLTKLSDCKFTKEPPHRFEVCVAIEFLNCANPDVNLDHIISCKSDIAVRTNLARMRIEPKILSNTGCEQYGINFVRIVAAKD